MSVCLSVCHNREHYKTAEPIEVPFGVRTRVGPRNHVIVGGSRSPAEGKFFSGGREHRLAHCEVYGISGVRQSYSVGGSSDAAFRCHY